MNYCINPKCHNFNAPGHQLLCPNCGPDVLLHGRYRVIQPLGRGAFGQTFEVDDVREGKRKVLKVLLTDYAKAVSLFQREAEVLRRLHHPGIPRVEPDGYFRLWLPDREESLHCLVMEYIQGINLRDWLSSRNNRPISQARAIAWLKQLAEILQQIHRKQYLHRDIKPSNIMLRPNRQLVLIDFGAVREVTETQLYGDGTAIVSAGYTPQEQAEGEAVFPQSDFYALGRTFVHFLTGICPVNLQKDAETDQLNWRSNAPQILPELAELIDDLMAPRFRNRPKNVQEILQRLAIIEQQAIASPLPYPQSSSLEVNHLSEADTKIPTSVGLWGLAVSAIVLATIGSLILLKPQTACNSKQGDSFSCGEEILVPTSEGAWKQKGVKKFAQGQYEEAVDLLEKARQEQPSDPETLIYLNNARLGNKNAYTIAVAAPIANNLNKALEILRGVAQAQQEINNRQQNWGLRVLISDDKNHPLHARKIAESLVLKKDILAVIGHYASEVTLGAIDIYQQHGLVLISPGSTSEDLSRWSNYPERVFFRTVPNNRVKAQALASYLITDSHQRKAAVFYTEQSNYSRSMRNQFQISFSASGREVVANFDLCGNNFNPRQAIEQAKLKGVTTFVLLPDGHTCSTSFDNVLNLMKANQGRFPMMGAWVTYDSRILKMNSEAVVDRLVISVPWHRLSSPNRDFPKAAEQLWKAEISGLTATTYDAARALIQALAKTSQPSRLTVRQALSARDFKANGATGTISFNFPGGDRYEPIFELVKVISSPCSPYGLRFIPVSFTAAQAESVELCQKRQ